MKNSNRTNDIHQMDVFVNTVALALGLTVIMAGLTHWVIKMYPPADPLISLMIAFTNGTIGAVFALNCKTWATQLSGFTKHESWDKEQIKLALLTTGMVLSLFGLAFYCLTSPLAIEKWFGAFFLLLPLFLARTGRNAINSRGVANKQRPTILT